MTYEPNRDPNDPARENLPGDAYNLARDPRYDSYERSSSGVALFFGAVVLIALVFGGFYLYSNDDMRVASDATTPDAPITQPAPPAAITPAPPANVAPTIPQADDPATPPTENIQR